MGGSVGATGKCRLDMDQLVFYFEARVADIQQTLRFCRLFHGVQGAAFERLTQMAEAKWFKAGTTIFRQGDTAAGVFIVASGMVRVFKLNPNGKEHVLHMVGRGGTFAEVAAMGNFACPAFAEAIEDAEVLLLPAEEFRKALATDHQLCLGLVQGMAMWVRHMVGIVEDVTLRDAAGRVARYLLEAPTSADGSIELPTLKRHLASHLNLTSETFSRTLRRLDEDGLIASTDGTLRVLDREGLQMLAEGL